MNSSARFAQTLTKYFTEKTTMDLEKPLIKTTFSCDEDKNNHSFIQAWIDIEISKLTSLPNQAHMVQFVKLLDYCEYKFGNYKSVHLIEKNNNQTKHLVQIENYFWASEQATQPEKFLYIECDFNCLERISKTLQEESDQRNIFTYCDSILTQLISVCLSWF
jgi:hypothetical protein